MDDYKQVPYDAELQPCNFCGSAVHMWQYTAGDDIVRFTVMCSLAEDHSPMGDDCPLFMPPDTFMHDRKSEAAKYWNEWAKVKDTRITK